MEKLAVDDDDDDDEDDESDDSDESDDEDEFDDDDESDDSDDAIDDVAGADELVFPLDGVVLQLVTEKNHNAIPEIMIPIHNLNPFIFSSLSILAHATQLIGLTFAIFRC